MVLTIGGFDGVHLGHQAIIRQVLDRSRQGLGCAGLVTFEPHPAKLLHPDFPYLLTPLDEKLVLLAELGIEYVEVLEFNHTLRNLEPEDFINQFILRLKPGWVVIGTDHRFGRDARGDIKLLKRILDEHRVGFEVVPEVVHLGAPVRSTRIREHLVLGHIRLANQLLGRPYAITGRTVKGTGTGRKLGFPTVNLLPVSPDKLLPAEGVYAGETTIGTKRFASAVNIGFRPTFDGRERSIEVHLLDFIDEVLPGTEITLRLFEHLRPEQRFSSPDALRQQVSVDILRVRQIYERERKPDH
ncbi:MAG: riboflavin biosynthesis protein RibF [candidate division WOR-3 bacterium]|jgi:riboflavin kinase/FMN adenylyltransferase